jgi:hypothetical protein
LKLEVDGKGMLPPTNLPKVYDEISLVG